MQPYNAPRFEIDEPLALHRLEVNLNALASRRPTLVGLLRAAPSIPLLRARSGGATCMWRARDAMRRVHSAYEPEDEARRLADLVPLDVRVVEVLGGGLGHLVVHLLEQRRQLVVLLVEPELRLLRAMLSLFDLAEPLRAGRLVLLVADESDVSTLAECPTPSFTLRLPALADVYASSARQLRFLRRCGGERGRMVAVAYKLLLGDVVDELEERGFAVRIVEPGELSVAGFRELCSSVRPQALFSMNFSPELALLATKFGIGYASWTIDPLPESRLRVVAGTDVARCVAFAHRRDIVQALERCGLASVGYLPLAAGRARHPVGDAAALEPYRAVVSFAGVSLAVEKEGLVARLRQCGASEEVERRALTWIGEEFRRDGLAPSYSGVPGDGSSVPRWLRDAVPSLDPRELADRINGVLSHLLRVHRVERLVPEGIQVWGDEGWESLGATYRGRAAHGSQLTAIYNASVVNLDIPRLYQRDIATMRVFDILACGGVLLTEPSAQILELFRDGEHLFTYRDDHELRARIAELAAAPERARAAAERGRSLVLREHLLSHRVDTLLSALESRGWFSS